MPEVKQRARGKGPGGPQASGLMLQKGAPVCSGPLHAAADAEPEVEVIDEIRLVSTLPAQLLQPEELIILLLKPSPWFIVLTSLRSLAVLTVMLLGAFVLDARNISIGLGRSDMTLVYLALVGLRLGWQFLEWLSHVYVMTDQRVIRVRGFFRVHVFEAPLSTITHTESLFSIRERLFALGTIGFATAGTARVEAYWMMVNKPRDVHQKILQTLSRYRR